jgi:hypothetical protein
MAEAGVAEVKGASETAKNLVKGITDKAAGKVPEKPIEAKGGGKEPLPVDPNAGKQKYLVDGKEFWLRPDEVETYVHKGIRFEPRISELARLQTETAQFLDLLKTDPAQVLFNPKVGLTPEVALQKILQSTKISDPIKETVGRWYYENVYKRETMDERDRAILERDERIAELSASEKARSEQLLAQENQVRVQQAMAQLSGQIKEALAEIGLPNIDTPIGAQLAKRVADVMRVSYLAHQPCTAKDAAAKVRTELKEYQKLYYDALDEDKLVEELGKENAEKVRKYFLKAVKAAEKDTKESTGKPRERTSERKTINSDQFHDYLDSLKNKK